jgi:hypothetical protein
MRRLKSGPVPPRPQNGRVRSPAVRPSGTDSPTASGTTSLASSDVCSPGAY